jgi:hypothetical protein
MNYEFKYRSLDLANTIACPNPHITIQTKSLAEGEWWTIHLLSEEG